MVKQSATGSGGSGELIGGTGLKRGPIIPRELRERSLIRPGVFSKVAK